MFFFAKRAPSTFDALGSYIYTVYCKNEFSALGFSAEILRCALICTKAIRRKDTRHTTLKNNSIMTMATKCKGLKRIVNFIDARGNPIAIDAATRARLIPIMKGFEHAIELAATARKEAV